jgi:DNA-binding IclR family transcriptional regulator
MKATRQVVSSAVKVLDALQLLCEADGPTPLARLAIGLGVSEPTAYRVAQTLVQGGFARPAGGGGYVATLEVVRLAGRITSRDPLTDICAEVFGPISDRFDEPVTICVPDGDAVLFVQKLSGPRAPRFYCDVGRQLPLHAGAAARCVLAHLPDPAFEHYLAHKLDARTPATRTSAQSLRDDRDHIRTHGYTVSVDEVDVGISAIGVPVLNSRGRLLCAAAIANVTARWDDADILARAKDMVEATAEIRARVGDTTLTMGRY